MPCILAPVHNDLFNIAMYVDVLTMTTSGARYLTWVLVKAGARADSPALTLGSER
jgi:hypothetical protein